MSSHCRRGSGVKCASTAAMDNERKLLEVLHRHPHPNILTVHGIVVDAPDKQVKLVMALCPGGSLDKDLTAIRNEGGVCVTMGPID